MRTVPRRPRLKPALRKCSTKPGRSVDPVRGSHSTAWPSLPAMDVKVPHSWAVRLEYPGRAAAPNAGGGALRSGGAFHPPPGWGGGGKQQAEKEGGGEGKGIRGRGGPPARRAPCG